MSVAGCLQAFKDKCTLPFS